MRAFKVCQQIIDCLLMEGYRLQVNRKDLENCIKKVRGVDPRTIRTWLNTLLTFNYIKLKAPNVYELNPFKVPELMKLLKEKPQVKLQ